MHCGSCALLIDDALEDVPGVISTRTSVKGSRTVVELETGQARIEDVVATITQLGYQAAPLT